LTWVEGQVTFAVSPLFRGKPLARKILLADDSVTAQNMGRKILADAGYEVITVNNGSAALKKIGEQRPDLIVLDVYMPGYSGLEVCQRLKEAGDTSRIPILLTVGKLEPFKPDEAKRVRADGYIVKPFEASELLSTLSKLEDKVVPRSESSKPGRFARATTAIEEGRYDKSMAVEEDAGWKNRISFPSKKKEKPAEQEIETGEIYNPVNKDLRTVVEQKPTESAASESAAPAQPEQAHVNVGALAPEGLPKDVTPEEIAALAAAAAQIQGKVGENIPAPPVAEGTTLTPPPLETSKADVVEAKAEEKRPVEAEPVPEVAAEPQATFAEQEHKETVEEKKSTPAVSTQADAMTAIMGLETQVMAVFSPGSGNGAWAHEGAEKTEPPMTMAAAAAAQSVDSPARWSAVAVALAPEEAALSLEQEMQKAYADFAAAESGHSSTVPESSSAALASTASAVIETPAPQVETAIPAVLAPEVAQPLSAVSEAATEAMSAAVKELEVVAAKYEAEHAASPTEPVADKPLTAEALESPAAVAAEVPANVEEKVEAKAEPQPELSGENESAVHTSEAALSPVADLAVPESKEVAPEISAAPAEASPEPEIPTATTQVPEPTGAATDIAEEKSRTESVSTDPAPVSNASKAGGIEDMAKRESETAAAWASWRKIRETGGPRSSNDSSSEDVSQDKAAMAVAAGAENKPEEVAALDSDPEISSLVDSVLADMRPKIVEEIAKKLGKKK